MKDICKILFLVVLLTLTSCFKQDAPEVRSDQIRTVRDLNQLKACSDITFYEGFLYRKNLLNLFICTSWDLKFVEMFKSLSATSDQHWNDLVAPFDEIFFSDRARRDRFIKYYQDLDNDGALDDLGRVITALTDTNFYDGLNALFVCADAPDSSVCKGRHNLVSKNEIKDLMLMFNRDSSLILELSNIVNSFHNALGGDAEKLRREIVKFNNTTFFNKLRILIVTKFAKQYLDGLKDGDLRLLRGFFSAKESGSNLNWMNQWLKRDDVNDPYVLKLMRFPVKAQPQMIRDLKVLGDLYKGETSCSDQNLQLKIDLKSLVGNTVSHLRADDIVKFFDTLLMANESIHYARPICPDLTDATRVVNYYEYSEQRNVNHAVDLSSVLTYSIELLAKNPTIDFAKFILALTEYDHGYLVDLAVSDSVAVAAEVNRVIVENGEGFYPTSLGILKRTDEKIFDSLSFILNNLFEEPSSADLRAWTKSWLFWNDDEKNFLFNFIDIHLDSDTDYVRLFSFYSLFLREVSSDWERLGNHYNKDDETKEQTYQALKYVLDQFHGERILQDYKKFFSRDHILELLKVITSGETFKESALSALLIRDIDQEVVTISPAISLVSREDFDRERLVNCSLKIAQSETLFELIKLYPIECSDLNDNYALDDISQGISLALGEFEQVFPAETVEHFFDVGGLLSPEMSMWMIASAISIDTGLQKEGRDLDFLFGTLKKYLLEIGDKLSTGTSILKNGLSLVIDWLGGDSDRPLRNGIVAEFVDSRQNFDRFYQRLPYYIKDLEKWNKSYKKPEYIEDEEYFCKNYLNIHVGKNICPGVEKVKSNIDLLAKQMITRHEESEGIPIEYILRAALPDGGVLIPLDSDRTKKKKLTLLETFNYLYDLSDKKLRVNREKVKYRNRLGGDKERYTMTTNERIDHVIRNVSFGDNYLGVQYLNAVVKGDDYSDVVKEKQRLMGVCLNTPGIRCGKSISKEELRKGKNAFWAYDGLVDVNNGNDLEPKMRYGEYMQAFMYSFVASSALEAQEVKLFPLDDRVLKKHNGKALGYFSEIAAFSNMGRVVHDRVGRTREEFEKFVNSKEFKRVSDMLLSRVSEEEIIKVAEQLFKTISSDGQDALGDLVTWLDSLSYRDLRMVEEIVAKSVYVSTYLGSERQVLSGEDGDTFENSSSFEFLYILNQVMREYKLLKSSFGAEYNLVNAIAPTLNFVDFLYEKLRHKDTQKDYWFFLNSGYAALREVLYIRGATANLVKNIIRKNKSSKIYSLISSIYEYLVQAEKIGTSDLQKTLEVTYSSGIGSDTLWKYFENTSVRSNCSIEKNVCTDNENYDQLIKIGYVLRRENNLEDSLDWLLVRNRETIINTAKDFFPFLKIVK